MSESSLSTIQPEVNLNSRFKLLERPLAIPGKCVTCGAVDRPVVDTGWSIDYYGVVYFCVFCLTEVATVIGMVDGKLLEEAETNSARQFNEELIRRDVRTVPSAEYQSWIDSVSNVHDALVARFNDLNVSNEPQATYSESTANENASGAIEQEFELTLNERSFSVSTSSSDGESAFGL